MGHMYSIIENVISQRDSGLYSARGVKFVVNFFLVFGSIEINPISRGTLKHSLPLIFCAFYVECWFFLVGKSFIFVRFLIFKKISGTVFRCKIYFFYASCSNIEYFLPKIVSKSLVMFWEF